MSSDLRMRAILNDRLPRNGKRAHFGGRGGFATSVSGGAIETEGNAFLSNKVVDINVSVISVF